ncbi:MAG TPA: hypothetical protein DIV40_05695 [Clostridiales bacterium]|jgi:hypothetical protein|nr:hypothetical protein [Clostridiales bacterium]
MGVKEIKQEIEINENNEKNKIKTLNDIREKIVEKTKPYVNEQLKKKVESAVKNNPDHTKELGKETLSEMKKRLTELLAISDEIVDKTFEDDKLWLHVNYNIVPGGDKFGQRYNNSKKAGENIQLGIRTVLGEAGRILVEYKYAKASGQSGNEWRIISNNKMTYAYALSLSKDLEELIKQYSKELEQLHDFVEKIDDLKQELSEQEALDLWDEV